MFIVITVNEQYMNFTPKEQCYYKMIDKFFKACSEESIIKVIAIIDGTSTVSLRSLDWFVTQYIKKKTTYDQTEAHIFDLHVNYKAQLKAYKKRYFDPFRRRNKFQYTFHNNMTVETTLGQLNFFKWAVHNNIIAFVEKHITKIITLMNNCDKQTKKKSILPCNKVDVKSTEESDLTLSFD